MILLGVLFFMLSFAAFFRIVQCLVNCIQVKIWSLLSLSITLPTASATVFLCYILLQAGKVFYTDISTCQPRAATFSDNAMCLYFHGGRLFMCHNLLQVGHEKYN